MFIEKRGKSFAAPVSSHNGLRSLVKEDVRKIILLHLGHRIHECRKRFLYMGAEYILNSEDLAEPAKIN